MNDDIFRSFLRKFIALFVDDIIIYSRTFEEHLIHIEETLIKLEMLKTVQCDPPRQVGKKTYDDREFFASLESQVTGSVRWIESIQRLVSMGHRTFVELGPGKVLAGLVAKIDKDATVISVEDLPSLEAAIETLS
jgi:malonyl CoA-acyl carrier protein transacylase